MKEITKEEQEAAIGKMLQHLSEIRTGLDNLEYTMLKKQGAPEKQPKPKTPIFIGLCGRSGSGKSFVAELIAARKIFGEKLVGILGFAENLKKEVAACLRISVDSLEDRKNEPFYRWLLQAYGTDSPFGRAADKDIWVKQLNNWLTAVKPGYEVIVVQDVRFANEAAWIKKQGGILIKVCDSHAESLPIKHASEELNFNVDYMLDNNTKGMDEILIVNLIGILRQAGFIS